MPIVFCNLESNDYDLRRDLGKPFRLEFEMNF